MKSFTKLLILVVLSTTFTAAAEESATFVREGFFQKITDAESAGYKIYTMRMSANGNVIAFTTSATDRFTVDSLRVINTDGTNERLIATQPEGMDYPRPFESYAISDDGSTIVYGLYVGFDGFFTETELREYNTLTTADRQVLREVSHFRLNSAGTRNIAHIVGNGSLLALSGDGEIAYIVNQFGPIGTNNDSLEPDGATIYKVVISTGQATKIVSQLDLPNIAGINPIADQVYSNSSRLVTNSDGSVLIAPMGNDTNIPRPRSLLRFDSTKGGATVLFNLDGGSLTGPSITSDGSLMTFATYDDAVLAEGTMLMNADGSGVMTVIDTGVASGSAREPRISGNGSVVLTRADLGGAVEPSIRYVPTDGSGPILISGDDTIIPSSNFSVHSVSTDASRIALIGRIRSGADTGEPDIIIFDWNVGKGTPSGIPTVQSVVSNRSFTIPIQSATLVAEVTDTFTYTPQGTNLGYMQAYALDDNLEAPNGLAGLSNYSVGVIDDGLFGDAVAGDGIYNDAGIWARNVATPGTVTGRAAITSTTGSASFVDYEITLRTPVSPTADFTADVTSGNAPLTVTFTDTSTGDYNFTDWDFTNRGSFDESGATEPVEYTYDDPGTYSVRMRARGFDNEDIVVKDMLIEVSDPSPPTDVNGDDSVNAVDIQLVINGALGLDVGSTDTDVNNDGTTNAVDLQLVINAALGL